MPGTVPVCVKLAICVVAFAALALPATAGAAPAQQAYAKASNTQLGDDFGWSVAISGDTMVVGAPGESSNATGIDGNQTDNGAGGSGAAYVFTRSAGTWSQQAYLKASNTQADDNFGYSVAISGDTIVVGAPFEDSSDTGIDGDQADNGASTSGAAYVFTRTGTTWSQQAYLKSSNTQMQDEFGKSVAISGDTIVVGAPFEASDATGIDGDETNNGAVFSGAAYVFTRSAGTWSQQAYMKASNTQAGDQFGSSVAISGDTIVVGAHGEDSDATGIGGDQLNDNAGFSGAAYVFTRSGVVWSQQAYLKASNTQNIDQFGSSVAVSGDTIVVAAHGESSNATGVNGDQTNNGAGASGAAYVFTRSGVAWSQQAYLKASNTAANDRFGEPVAISGDTIAVGANSEDSNATGVNGNQADNSANFSGAAYAFTRSAGIWSQEAYVKASNTQEDDQFGWDVAVSGDTIVASSPIEASNATGVNGNQADNSANFSGAAYVFAPDGDGDGVTDEPDNCPSVANTGQENLDADSPGDACDSDDDNDGAADAADSCPMGAIGPGDDLDGDGCKSAEDSDDDNDSAADAADSCPMGAIGPGDDLDGDGCKSAEDPDDDGDQILDAPDNCPILANPGQGDLDADGIGDACDASDGRPLSPETTIGRFPKNPKQAHTHFRFRSSIPGSTFTCALDDGNPKPCRSPKDYRHLETGRHVFTVAATSPAGKTDLTPATARFRVKSRR